MKVTAVLRFWYEGKLVDKGAEVEVDESLGREIIASGKAVATPDIPAREAETDLGVQAEE